jgi:hypothetical protein
MKLSKLAAKPQLIKITIDDEATVKEFGEAVDFWIYDRQPMNVFMSLASMDEKNIAGLVDILKQMIYDEDGKLMLKDGIELPLNIMMKVMEKIMEKLGNGISQTGAN